MSVIIYPFPSDDNGVFPALLQHNKFLNTNDVNPVTVGNLRYILRTKIADVITNSFDSHDEIRQSAEKYYDYLEALLYTMNCYSSCTIAVSRAALEKKEDVEMSWNASLSLLKKNMPKCFCMSKTHLLNIELELCMTAAVFTIAAINCGEILFFKKEFKKASKYFCTAFVYSSIWMAHTQKTRGNNILPEMHPYISYGFREYALGRTKMAQIQEMFDNPALSHFLKYKILCSFCLWASDRMTNCANFCNLSSNPLYATGVDADALYYRFFLLAQAHFYNAQDILSVKDMDTNYSLAYNCLMIALAFAEKAIKVCETAKKVKLQAPALVFVNKIRDELDETRKRANATLNSYTFIEKTSEVWQFPFLYLRMLPTSSPKHVITGLLNETKKNMSIHFVRYSAYIE